MIYKICNDAGNDVWLCPRRDSDFKGDLYAWFTNPKLNIYTSHARTPYVIGTTLDTDMIWWIQDLTTHINIGTIGLHLINYLNRSAEIAIMIGVAAQHNKGTGYHAVRKIIEHGFEQLNLNRIWLGTHHDNIAMIKIAEKCGMNVEGVQKQALWKNGQYHDIINYAILKKEYDNI